MGKPITAAALLVLVDEASRTAGEVIGGERAQPETRSQATGMRRLAKSVSRRRSLSR
jgi:hypothetical protein